MSARLALAAALLVLGLPSAASAAPVFTPDPVEFGDREVGTVSGPIDVTVTNDSADVYEIGDAVLDGDDPADFEIVSDSCSGTDLDQSSSCVVSLRFAPTAAGDRLAVLVLENAGTGDDHGVFAAGFAYDEPTLAVPASLDFAATRRRQSSRATATVTNTGDGPIAMGTPWTSGPDAASFVIATNGCASVVLAPGDSCGIGLDFWPAHIGSHAGALMIESDAAGAPHAVQMAGTALPVSELRLEPAEIDFGVLTQVSSTASRDVTVHNAGPGRVLLQPAVPLSPLANIIRRQGTCTERLEPGASCRLTLTIIARHPGALSGNVTFRDRSTADQLAVLPVRAQIDGPFLIPWRGRAQLDIPLAAALKFWRQKGRRALIRRGFVVHSVGTNLGGQMTLEVFAFVPGKDSAAVKRLIARGSALGQAGVARDLVARTTRRGKRVLALRRALRLRAELTLRAADGRRFATGMRVWLPKRRR